MITPGILADTPASCCTVVLTIAFYGLQLEINGLPFAQ